MDYNFSKDFFWGAATSATQSEGTIAGDNKGENIWDYASKTITIGFEGVTTEHTSRFYQEMEADLDRMAALSFNSFRTSISWSRLIPEGTGS